MYFAAIRRNSTYTFGVSAASAPWLPPLHAFKEVGDADCFLAHKPCRCNKSYRFAIKRKEIYGQRGSFSPRFSLTRMKQTNIGDGEATGASSAGSAYGQP